MSQRFRTALAILLCLLVVGMQQEMQRHALSHFARAAGSQEQVMPTAPEIPCAECALLAAGFCSLLAGAATAPGGAPVFEPAFPMLTAGALSRPSFYRSRAPPALS